MELEETRLLVPHLICICQFLTKKSQDKVSLGPYSGDAIEMSLSTRAFQRWYDCGNLFFFYFGSFLYRPVGVIAWLALFPM